MTSSCFRMYIIGAGQLGSRHLQGLSIINQDVEIIVIDPNSVALELAQKRYEEMPSNSHVRSVNYHRDIPGLDGEVDLAIIATNADIRRKVIENLLGKTQIKYLILEKVVFQSVRDFEFVMNLLDKNNVKTWVNCPRRIHTFFRKLQEETILSDSIKIRVMGSSWGLASNAIHMLDLFAFLTGQKEVTIDAADLDKKIYKSKRSKFVELGGRLVAQTLRGDILDIADNRKADNHISSLMCFETDKQKIEINQLEGFCRIPNKNNVKETIKQPFNMPLQSELTAKLAEQILDCGHSDLTPLDESYLLHRPMLDAFNAHLSSILKEPVTVCPIT